MGYTMKKDCKAEVEVYSFGPVSDKRWDIVFGVKTSHVDTGGRFEFEMVIANENGSIVTDRKREVWTERGKDDFQVIYSTILHETQTR